MTDKKAKAQTVATSSKNRRARKKRRTEISSSEEDSSDDGDSSSDGDANDSDNAVEDAPAELQTQQDAVAEIEHLRVRSRAPVPGDEKTAEDVVQTRMKLRQMQDLLVADGAAAVGDGGASESQDVAAVSSDDWLKLMLSQYGDDIDALRTGAGDFRGESVTPGTAMLEKLHRERRYTDGQKEHAGEHAGEQTMGEVAAGRNSRRRSEGG